MHFLLLNKLNSVPSQTLKSEPKYLHLPLYLSLHASHAASFDSKQPHPDKTKITPNATIFFMTDIPNIWIELIMRIKK